MGWKGDLLVKTRYARAQEEYAQLQAELAEMTANYFSANHGIRLASEKLDAANKGNETLRGRLYEVVDERNVLAAALDAANTKLEESTAALGRERHRPLINRSNPSVDESRLREMALSMASSLVGSGEFVTTRAQKYLDFLKGDAEPKQPPFADGEGVFE